MPLEDKRVPEVTWPLAEGCFCRLGGWRASRGWAGTTCI